jgi:predicted PurR-regulated permease PerM
MDRARVGERGREIRTNTLTRTRIHASRLNAPFGEAQGNRGWHMSLFQQPVRKENGRSETLAMAEIQRDTARGVLAVLFIVTLIGSSIWILRPFLGAIVWATTIVVATWPLMIAAQAWLWGKRALAVTLMTLLLSCVLVVPLTFAIGTIVSNVDDIVVWVKSLASFKVPSVPPWIADLPLVGPKAVELWERVAAAGIQEAAMRGAPYAGGFIKWFVTQLGGVGVLLVEFLLTVILAAAMFANGELASARLVRFGHRLAGSGGENAVYLAGQTIRGVALGVVVTAVAQTVFSGLGVMIAGVPFAGVLTAAMLLLAIAQIGVVPVLGAAVAWLFWTGDTAWETFLLVWTVVAGTMDNFLRPILIRKGADLPLLLIFAGVIGGLLAFGLIGIFVGPVVLAVADTLLNAWIDAEPKAETASESQAPTGE